MDGKCAAAVHKSEGIFRDGQGVPGKGYPPAAPFRAEQKAALYRAEGKGYGKVRMDIPSPEKVQKIHIDMSGIGIPEGIVINVRNEEIRGQLKIDHAVRFYRFII